MWSNASFFPGTSAPAPVASDALEASADALLANKKMRALRRGLMIMDVALHPLGKASKKMREQRRVRATKRWNWTNCVPSVTS